MAHEFQAYCIKKQLNTLLTCFNKNIAIPTKRVTASDFQE